MSPLSTTRSGCQTASCAPSSAPHSSRLSNCTHGTMNVGMPYSSACAKPVGLAVGADDDDARRVVGIGRRIEQSPQIRPGARDEDGDREHAASLPAAPPRPSPGSEVAVGGAAGHARQRREGERHAGRAAGGVRARVDGPVSSSSGFATSTAARPRRGCGMRSSSVACAAAARTARLRGAASRLGGARREQQDAGAEEHLESDGERDGSGLRAHLGERSGSDRARRDDGQQRGARRGEHGDAERDDEAGADRVSASAGARSVDRGEHRLAAPDPARAAAAVSARSPASADVRSGSAAASGSATRRRSPTSGGVAARRRDGPRRAVATSRERAIHPASAPSATGPSASSSSHGVVDSGMIPRTGMPGTTPTCVPAGETDGARADARSPGRRRTRGPRRRGRQVGELGERDDGRAEHVEVRRLVQRDDLAAAQHERDGDDERAEADEAGDDDRRSRAR